MNSPIIKLLTPKQNKIGVNFTYLLTMTISVLPFVQNYIETTDSSILKILADRLDDNAEYNVEIPAYTIKLREPTTIITLGFLVDLVMKFGNNSEKKAVGTKYRGKIRLIKCSRIYMGIKRFRELNFNSKPIMRVIQCLGNMNDIFSIKAKLPW